MIRCLLAFLLFASCAAAPAFSQTGDEEASFVAPTATARTPMSVDVDARRAPSGLLQASVTIPVSPGPFTFVYPKWIPGEHGPTGPLRALAMLHVSSAGETLQWRRDHTDMYAFHVDVPPGGTALQIDFMVLLNGPDDIAATRNVLALNWNRALVYQAGVRAADVHVKASVVLPTGWRFATSLPQVRSSGASTNFAEVNLVRLVDSPLDAGRYYRGLPLWSSGDASAVLDVFAEKPEDLEVSPQLSESIARLIPEAIALFGARHWKNYHAMLALSDAMCCTGIEHHESSDDRAGDAYLTDPVAQEYGGDLLAHELSHSWNGKYRRPADLITPNFQVPMRTDLLWVYEGLNQYLGDLLSFRSGIRDRAAYSDYLSNLYARVDSEPGRLADPLVDTATSAPFLYGLHAPWTSLRRASADFYVEGELLWLDVDTIIRERTAGKASIETFLHRFAGSPNTLWDPETVPYTRADIESTLSGIVPYAWHDFFERYVYGVSEHPPTDEFGRLGLQMRYTDKPNAFTKADEARRHNKNFWYSLGFLVSNDGVVSDVRRDSPAWSAGMAPGMRILAVNKRHYDAETLTDAIREGSRENGDTTLLTEQDGWIARLSMPYNDGLRYPHLKTIQGAPSMLEAILKPLRKQ